VREKVMALLSKKEIDVLEADEIIRKKPHGQRGPLKDYLAKKIGISTVTLDRWRLKMCGRKHAERRDKAKETADV
jgi:hypothetical protein